MKRRSYLSALGVGLLAGCAGTDRRGTSGGADTVSGSTTGAPQTSTPRERPNTIFVAPDGSLGASGTSDDPHKFIQEAVERARPGDTVHVRPGAYTEKIEPPHGGEPGAPITITGPPEAVLRSDPRIYNVVFIRHSHIHLTGLSIDGLENPDAPDDVNSYSRAQLVQARPPTDTDEYLEDLVIAPHRIGNTQKSLVSLERTQHSTVGPFEVIGPAGTKYFLTDTPGHNGEIVYVGTSPSNLGKDWHPWTEYDRTSDIHVHHLDNSAGHPHSEIVNTKLGTSDILVEYCTDGGGSANTEDSPAASVRFQSFGATVRWCDLRNGNGHGVEVGSYKARDARAAKDDPSEIERRGGADNAVYGNRITGFDDKAIAFPAVRGQDDQRAVCGNTYDGATDGTPDRACPDDLPRSDGIGHTAGASGR
ncbi:hypothetical protein [Halobellus rubicundus]|uniref:DUF1565 domain-containing protein n=1 Tax=Halobellus rubicundus TaxID=2996466 RepID=A0ABD5MG12_9EURY